MSAAAINRYLKEVESAREQVNALGGADMPKRQAAMLEAADLILFALAEDVKREFAAAEGEGK